MPLWAKEPTAPAPQLQGGKVGTRTHAGCHGQHMACPGCPEALGAGAGESLGLQRISLTRSHTRIEH